VDEYSKTNIDSIYAIGDVTNRIALTPVALMEGGALAKTLFNNQPTKPDHKFVATAVFSQPHIGTCGYTEEEAVEEFGDVDVYTSTFKPMKSGFIGSDQRALYKVVVDHKTDKVIGMHLIGPDSGEIMQVLYYLLARLLTTVFCFLVLEVAHWYCLTPDTCCCWKWECPRKHKFLDWSGCCYRFMSHLKGAIHLKPIVCHHDFLSVHAPRACSNRYSRGSVLRMCQVCENLLCQYPCACFAFNFAQ
jgi:hypothetical protein